MAVLDPTTQAAWLAAATDDAKALTIVSALTEPVTVEIRNAADTLMAEGTMLSPWAFATGGQVTLGEVDSSLIEVAQAGVPDGSWRLLFKGANGRYVQCGFGLPGSGREIIWSLASWSVGDQSSIGTVILNVLMAMSGSLTLNPSNMDATTAAAYNSGSTAAARAANLVAALTGTVVIEVCDSTNAVRASGTMVAPWATSAAAVVSSGEVNSSGLQVTNGGTPGAGWYVQFRAGARYVRGSFGLVGSGQEFLWPLPAFTTGMRVTIGTVAMTAVAPAGVPVNTSVPTISGTAQEGQTLSAGVGTWSNAPTGYVYQWQRSANGSTGWADISGATAQTYLLQSGDVNQYVRCGVRASNASGPAVAYAYSLASTQVSALPVPTASTGYLYPLFDAQYGGGPTHQYQNRLAKVPWDNPGGDWNGAGEVQQGSTPYASVTDTSTAANHALTFNVTSLLQFIQANDKLAEVMVRTSGSRYFASRTHPTTGLRPTISVTYTDATTATLSCLGDGYMSSSTSYSPSTVTENICTGSNNVWLRFQQPTKAVQSATMTLYATQSFGGTATVNVFRLRNQGEKAIAVQQGIAAAYQRDVGIESHPSVVRRFDFQGAESTWKVNAVGNINSRDWFDPNDPPTRTDRLPLLEKGKWIAGNFSDNTSNYEVVGDTYTQYGYAPLYPGQKTIHHWLETDDNPAITWEMFLWPLEPELYLRYYVRFGDNMFDDVDRGDVLYGQPEMNLVGKFGPSFAHRSLAGNGGAFPEGNDGWSMRANFTCISNAADPKHRHIVLGDYVYDVDQYQVDFSWQTGARGTFERGKWYCIERYIKLNTPNQNDGISRAWVDGQLCYEKTNHRWRNSPPYYNGTGPSSERRVYGDMSVASIWWDWWNGGLTLPAKRVDCFIGDIVISRSYIGPMTNASTASVPSWAPAPGDTAAFTSGGGVLANRWAAIHDPTGIGYDPFHSRKVTDYSATFLHVDWKTHGATVIFGGGHSATNFNGVTALAYEQDAMRFECLQTGTPWTGGVLDIGDNNSQYNSQGEALVGPAGRIASPHSYGNCDVVNGRLIQTHGTASGFLGLKDGNACHELDLTNPATAATARQWVRRATGFLTGLGIPTAPHFQRYVPAQNRVYIATRGDGSPSVFHWFDLTTNTFVNGTGRGFDHAAGTIESGGLIHVPSRDLLVCVYRNGSGQLVVQYAQVGVANTQPVAATATLSANIGVPDGWGAACWCSDNNRLLIFGATGNTNRVYEIAINATLNLPWTVDSHLLPSGKTINPPANQSYGKQFDYNPKTKCVAFFPLLLQSSGNDTVQVYRPRNT